LPTRIAKVPILTRPPLALSIWTFALALVVPLAAVAAVLALVEWSWLAVAGVLLVGGVSALVERARTSRGDRPYSWPAPEAVRMLERLCIRADMRVPELVVEGAPVANAWTARGRIHLTTPLLRLLDDTELEAVLAHELAHLAHRDAAVMDICSAPSRLLLAFADRFSPTALWRARSLLLQFGQFSAPVVALAVLGAPPAFAVGWTSRLSVLGMSRAREFTADAAAAALTGRPSALASALMKLDRKRDWTARSDLREVYPLAVLCIVRADKPRLGPLFATHPATSARVARLEAIEARLQRRAGAAGR
jgi:heat shock protein HtpX